MLSTEDTNKNPSEYVDFTLGALAENAASEKKPDANSEVSVPAGTSSEGDLAELKKATPMVV